MARLIEELNKLPGVGPKSAQRLAYHLLRASLEEAQALAQAIVEMKEAEHSLPNLPAHYRDQPLLHLPGPHQRPD